MDRSKLVQQIEDKRTAATAILDACETGGVPRAMSADEQTRFNGLMADGNALKATLASLDALGGLDVRGGDGAAGGRGDGRQSNHDQFGGQSPAIHGDRAHYSYIRAIRMANDRREVDGVEREVSQEVRRRGKNGNTDYHGQFTVPLDPDPELYRLMYPRSFEARMRLVEQRLQREMDPSYRAYQTRDLTITTGAGGLFNIPEFPMIDYLRARMVLAAMGCTFLTNMQGLFAIPRQTGKATAYWSANEAATASTSNLTLDQVPFTPHLVILLTNISRQFINQTSLSAETLAMDDLTRSLAVEMDRVGINGLGSSGQPLGIIQNSTVQSNSSGLALGPSGGAPTWASIINMETQIANYNADEGELQYLTNPIMRGTLKQTLKVASSTFPIFIWEDAKQIDGTGVMNGYRARTTSNVPSNTTKGSGANLSAIVLGYWTNLVMAYWGDGLDMLVNPYTNQSSAAVLISVEASMDVNPRHPENFAVITDCATDAY